MSLFPALRADLWALAGILAVDKTIEANNLACQQKLACQANDLACLADDCFSPPSGRAGHQEQWTTVLNYYNSIGRLWMLKGF